MNPRILATTTKRILRQLRHDRRTLAIMVVIPCVLMGLLYALWDGEQPLVSRINLDMIGVFPFLIMFLLTSVTMVRERITGTLERLMTTRTGKFDLLFAYGLAFGLMAAVQATVAAIFAYWVLDMQLRGSLVAVIAVGALNAVVAVAIGLVGSSIARTEFQALQLFPVLVLPQIILCGLLGPREQMAGWLQGLSNAMPLTYAVEALHEVAANEELTALFWRDLGIVAVTVVVALSLGAATLRRRTP